MNAYATVEYADEYLGNLITGQAWGNYSPKDKERALCEATVKIDALSFRGRKSQQDQSREFPRYPDSLVPEAVMRACCHEALSILQDTKDKAGQEREAAIRQGVKSISIGDVSESYAEAAELRKGTGGLGSAMALALLRPYLAGRGVAPII